MLHLSRKIGQAIHIGNNIRITVLDVKGKTVRFGIESPPEISILREELYESVFQANLAASASLSEEADMNIILNLESQDVNNKE